MKDPSNIIRQWLYNVLYQTVYYNNVVVPVYSFPPKDAAMPYIVIGEQMMTGVEEDVKDCYITVNDVTLEIYSSHTGNDATYKPVNSIAEDILELVIQRSIETHGSGGNTVATLTGYTPIHIKLTGSNTDRFLMDTNIVIFKSLNINLLLEEL